MAEIELSTSAEERGGATLDRSQHLNFEGKEQQTSPSATTLRSDGLEDVQISYEYLEFETALLTPTGIASPNRNGPPPDPPNLRPYTSPFEWSQSRKTFMIWLSCASTVVAAYSAGSYSAGNTQMSEEWGVSDVALNVGVTAFTTGFAVAPMVLGIVSTQSVHAN